MLSLVVALTLGAPALDDVRWPGAPQPWKGGALVSIDGALHDIGGPKPRRLFAEARDPAVSPDGRRVAYVGPGGQLFVARLPDGAPTQLTRRAGGVRGPVWSPDGAWLVVRSPVPVRAALGDGARAYDALLHRHWKAWDDGQRSHLFVVPARGGAPARDLTPGARAAPSRVINQGRGYAIVGRRLIFTRWGGDPAGLDVSLWSVPLKGGPATPVTTAPGWEGTPVAGPRGAWAHLERREPGYESDRARLVLRRRGRVTTPAAALDRSVAEVLFAPDGGLWFTAERAGRRGLFEVVRGEARPALPGWSVRRPAFGPDGALWFVASRLDRPPEVYRWRRGDAAPRARTRLNAAFGPADLGRARALTATTAEGHVPGFVVTPPGFDPARSHPLVVLIHGGPEGAHRHEWHARWTAQRFARAGYVVALPNPRGSTGYGARYRRAVRKDWGGGTYRDVLAFTDAVQRLPGVGARACAVGGSYGGYMVSWIAGHTERFDCLVAHAPVFDLPAFWFSTDELWFPEWEFGGPPWEAAEQYARWSPSRFVHRAKTPTLVLHGEADYRVPLEQGLGLFTALQRLGVPSRLVTFPGEGHWIEAPKSQARWRSEILSWLARYLKPGGG